MQLVLQIVDGYRKRGSEVYFVGLRDGVKKFFTSSKIWNILSDDSTATSFEECVQIIQQKGGNLAKAATFAQEGNRDITEKIARFQQLAL